LILFIFCNNFVDHLVEKIYNNTLFPLYMLNRRIGGFFIKEEFTKIFGGVSKGFRGKSSVIHQRRDFATADANPSPDSRRAFWAASVGNLAALANWTIPLAAISSLKRDPDKVNFQMTGVLAVYSLIFVRWSIAVFPRNYPLFFCHITNSIAQSAQIARVSWYKLNNRTEKK